MPPALEDAYILSPMQQGLLFHSLYAPAGSLYVDQLILEIRGAIEPAVLAAAWRRVVARHPVLRTSFHWQGLDKPVQVVHRDAEVPFGSHEPSDAGRAASRLEEIRQRAFDLSRPPLLRLDWLPIGDEAGLLGWTYHHILVDAWSCSVVLAEVFAAYQALARGAEPELAAPRRIGEYIAWLRRRDASADEAFWRTRLAGFRTPTPLGIERGVPPSPAGDAHGERALELDGGTLAALRAFARRHQLTLNTLVQGAWALLLHRYSGEPEVVFGATVAGRPEEVPGIESMVGLFINTLPIRSRWRGDGDTVSWLREIQSWQMAVQKHAHTQLADIQRWSEVPAGRPLFASIVVFENVPPPRVVAASGGDAPGLEVGGWRYVSRTHYPLSLLVDPGERLTLRATFERRILDAPAVERLLGHCAALLAGLAAEPAPALDDLPLLGAGERHQLLREWQGDPASAGAPPLLVHALVARQARATPAAVALIDGAGGEGATLTYAALDSLASRLAGRLRGLGVGPEVPVVVAVERSAAAVVALLGVLAAGGVYVPVDPAVPDARLVFVLADTAAPVLIAGRRRRAAPPTRRPAVAAGAGAATDAAAQTDADAGISLVRLDAGGGLAEEEEAAAGAQAALAAPPSGLDAPPADLDAAAALPLAVSPGGLAYVIYTSGSTGEPKGVAVSHQAAAAHFAAVAEEYGIAPGERVLQFTSFAFDAGLEQVLCALARGATLVLRGEEAWDPAELGARLGELGIAVTNLPSSYWARWAQALPGAAEMAAARAAAAAVPAALRLVIAGGEAMPAAAIAAWQGAAPAGVRLLNAYGPTEAVVTATLCEVPRPLPEGHGGPPLGRPLSGRTAYVLDSRLEPLPAGVPGELFLGGRLARGYLRRPRLTAASFVPDPWSAQPGARLYRSGDRVRALADGRLEYLGRTDRQLKVRGLRIEPGEIEAALALHQAVADAAVVAREGADGPVLVAYVEPRAPGATAAAGLAAELRELLRERLPAPWIPADFVLLERPARTAGGKLDRGALPEWRPPAAGGGRGHRSTDGAGGDRQLPRDAVEELLASLWSAVLGVPEVGIHDDFLELGGHSLLAMRLLSRVREAFAVELPLASLFDAATVAGQAEQVTAALAGGVAAGGAAPALAPVPRDRPLPLSFAQQRLWILDQFDPGLPAYNMPLALRFAGDLEPRAVAAALTALTARHEALRTRFAVLAGTPAQIVAPGGRVPLPVIDLRQLPAARRETELLAVAGAEARRRFDLARGPLLRAVLPLLARGEHALLLTVHHIVADGWSLGILLRELGHLYAAAVAGRRRPLPELPALAAPPAPHELPALAVQYADYAVWQREWLQGEVLERQLAFWRQRLHGLPPALDLPLDRPRPPLQTFRGARVPLQLDGGAAARVRVLARAERATVFMTLAAALLELLARYSRRPDFAIGTPVANRGRLETEGLIGFFVNTLVLRADLDGRPTVRQLLARVRAATLAATAHQDLPFEKLVEELRPERSLAVTPFFQVLLAFESPPPPPALAGLRVSPIAVESGAAKFDLTFSLAEVAGGDARSTAADGAAGASGGGDAGILAGALEYNCDLFDAPTAHRLAAHFAALVAGFAAHPERAAATLPVLAASELQQLVVEWNDTRPQPAGVVPIHRLFERQAAATPNAPAVTCGGDTLSYRELDRRATSLALRLVQLGIGPDVPAGIFLERTPELLVALLAVLKAGGAYVPLDPAYPRERLAATLDDCRAPVVLTQEWLVERLPDTAARRVLVEAVPAEPEAASAGGGANGARQAAAEAEAPMAAAAAIGDSGPGLPATLPAESLAYLIYTSGSTGRPKGVAIPHASAFALLSWALAHFSAAELAAVVASTSICFDLSVFEIFAPLSAGGRVHLVDSALDLLAIGDAERVTLVNTVPSLLAEVMPQGLPASVRTLNLAGEPIPLALAEWLSSRSGLQRVWNLYGPSETTTYSTAAAVTAADSAAGRQPPIGRPIAGTEAHLLDGELEPVPIGAAGELYLGGLGLARGYWQQPAATAASFVPHPLGEPGARLYRTGDLARALPGGRLEYLGRRDAQVKVRGFRIEPGEIEAALAHHPSLAQAIVAPRRDDGAAALDAKAPPRAGTRQDLRLVAYVVPHPGQGAAAPAELRAHLRRTLPEFMVPAFFVELAALPLLPNGKVDRAALPAPAAAAARGAAHGYVPPRTAIERVIAGVLCEVLRVERVGRDDNFFDLGGHSLLMIRAAGMLEQLLDRKLRVLELFRFPTVAALAEHLSAEPADAGAAAGEPAAAEAPAGRRDGSGRGRRRGLRRDLDLALAAAEPGEPRAAAAAVADAAPDGEV